jgi:hypothetical protein
MSDPRPTDPYENPITDRLRVTPTWADLHPDLSDQETALIHEHQHTALLDEALALMRNKIRRLEEERETRHPADLETLTNARTRPQIAEAARLVAQLIITQEVSAPEGRAILYALQLSLSALKSNAAKPRRRTPTRNRSRKARTPCHARNQPRRPQKKKVSKHARTEQE